MLTSLFSSQLSGRARSLLHVVAGVALAACEGSTASEPEPTTTYGSPIAIGQGSARVYVVATNGVPAEVGVALSEAALQGLPADGAPGGAPMPDGHHTYQHVLQMPAQNPTPYKFVLFDWNPGGHEPPGTYDLPHFDFHFYLTSNAERTAIVPSDPAFLAKANRLPAAEFVPGGYQKLPGGVPLMGAHWVDLASPELNGQRFTRTFLYGSWDGTLTFAEPMITREFLETRPDVRASIATPQRYASPGFYATEYRVYWNAAAKEYRVALTRLVNRQ